MKLRTKTDDILRDLKKLCKYALELGGTRAQFFDADMVVVDERVRLKCMVPVCPNFGVHFLCPPKNVPSINEFREMLAQYSYAILIQVDTPISEELGEIIQNNESVSDTYKNPTYVDACEVSLDRDRARLHEIINKIESKAFSMGFYFATGLLGGTCKLCTHCVSQQSGEACRHPFKARPSMEAVGIDVFKTAKTIGFALSPPKDTVRWTGLILVD